MDASLLPIVAAATDHRLTIHVGTSASLAALSLSVTLLHRDGRVESISNWGALDARSAASLDSSTAVVLQWDACGDGMQVAATITNKSGAALTLEQLDLRVGGMAQWWAVHDTVPAGLRVAYCGAHSRSQTSRSFVTQLRDDTALESWWVGALSGATGPGIVLGGMRPERFVTRVRVDSDALSAEIPLEQWTLSPGESVTIDPLWIGATRDAPLLALERFAELLGAAQSARLAVSPPSGWGSWGHWLERIDAGLMREMVHAIDGSAALRNVIDIVQIDDGWSELLESRRVSASWRPNPRFPSGLAPLATEIARTGRRCGLWILPFTVNAGSAIVETHPEWLVRDEHGAPQRVGGSEAYCLDPTHPDAAAWLTELLHRFGDWGIDYIKLDFLRALLAPDPAESDDSFREPRRYHAARTRLEAYRAGLAVIRAAVGDATTIVACSAPAAAGVGLIDCHRIGPDIERGWTGRLAGVRDAARAVAANWFWQSRTWVNDPDYLLVCESEALTRFWATVVALSGGSVILSADLSTMSPWAEAMLAFVLPPVGRSARPLDLFSRGPEPRRWALPFERDGERWMMLGLLNWGDRPIAERVAPTELQLDAPLHVWDAWRQRHSIAETAITVPIEAQSAALLRLTPVTDVPTMIGSEIHWAQGWIELLSARFDVTTGVMRIVPSPMVPRAGRIWIWVPDGWALERGAVAGGKQLAVVMIDGPTEAVIIFSRSTTAPLERTTRVS